MLGKHYRGTIAPDEDLLRMLMLFRYRGSLKRDLGIGKVVMMQNSQNQGISQQTKILIRLLVLSNFTLAEVAMVTGIPKQELKSYLDFNSHLEF